MRKRKEEQIENAILQYLVKVRHLFFWKVDYPNKLIVSNGKIIRGKHKSKYVIAGVSDIIGLVRGRMIAIEVKTKTEHMWVLRNYDRLMSTHLESIKSKKDLHIKRQIDFIENVKRNGGKGFFCSGVEQLSEHGL